MKPSLLVFIVAVVMTGSLIGYFNVPGDWYAALAKPAFNPPSGVFAPAWTTLYVLIAMAGWRTWRDNPRGKAFYVWIGQMVLNFAWSPVFFGMQRMDAALGIIVAMLAAIFAFMALRWYKDRVSVALFVPYAAWVAFATLLNYSLVALN